MANLDGVPDFLSDPTRTNEVFEAQKLLRQTVKSGAEPQWDGAFSPLAFITTIQRVICVAPFVIVAAQGTMALVQRQSSGEYQGAVFKRWWIGWQTFSPKTGVLRKQRFIAYAMDDEGCETEVEFRSALELRTFSEAMNPYAVGEAQSISVMPFSPELQLLRMK